MSFKLVCWLSWLLVVILGYTIWLDIDRVNSLEASHEPAAIRTVNKDKARGLLGAIERKLSRGRR